MLNRCVLFGSLTIFVVSTAIPAALAQASAKAPAKAPAKAAPALVFKPATLDLAPGETYPVEILVRSPSGKVHKGALTYEAGDKISVTQDPRWKGTLPKSGMKVYPKLKAAPDAQGEIPVTAKLENGGEGKLTVRIVEPGFEVIPGEYKLTVRITSPFTERLLTGRVEAANEDRFLQNVTAREFKVAPGKSQELVFPLPGAAPVCGDEYKFDFVIETYQGYKVKRTLALTFPPHTPKEFQ